MKIKSTKEREGWNDTMVLTMDDWHSSVLFERFECIEHLFVRKADAIIRCINLERSDSFLHNFGNFFKSFSVGFIERHVERVIANRVRLGIIVACFKRMIQSFIRECFNKVDIACCTSTHRSIGSSEEVIC